MAEVKLNLQSLEQIDIKISPLELMKSKTNSMLKVIDKVEKDEKGITSMQ